MTTTTTPRTTRAPRHNFPWTPKMPANRKIAIDVDSLVIEDAPPPTHRAKMVNKYDAKFRQMKVGQALRCKPDEVAGIAGAMRNWLKEKGHHETTRVKQQAGADGHGRVWMLKK